MKKDELNAKFLLDTCLHLQVENKSNRANESIWETRNASIQDYEIPRVVNAMSIDTTMVEEVREDSE